MGLEQWATLHWHVSEGFQQNNTSLFEEGLISLFGLLVVIQNHSHGVSSLKGTNRKIGALSTEAVKGGI